MSNQDLSDTLRGQVLGAIAAGLPLQIAGGGSKAFYGRKTLGSRLEVAGHSGVVFYEPTELVLTARAGTPLREIEAALAREGQMLGFEPPHFGPGATLGGAVACGLSGPRRPYAGAARDFVLGVNMINGKGEVLSFGGQVMKNVAGFDVSRLMVGALGTLGLLLEISLKVLPRPEQELTLVFEHSAESALAAMNLWAGQKWPISAACHAEGRLHLRLSGAEAALRASQLALGGEALAQDAGFWEDLREQRLDFFRSAENLWRLSLPPATPSLAISGACLMDWGGALRWLSTAAPAATVFAAARQAGGHATLFRSPAPAREVFQALPEGLRQLHIRLKQAFDPLGIFNPGRLYEGL
jgi:glycolate oxidase FAD binding subunit